MSELRRQRRKKKWGLAKRKRDPAKNRKEKRMKILGILALILIVILAVVVIFLKALWKFTA